MTKVFFFPFFDYIIDKALNLNIEPFAKWNCDSAAMKLAARRQ